MNLQEARIVLRPRKLAETFDLGLRWCASVGRVLYLKLALVVLLPAALACYALRVALEWEWSSVWLAAVAMAVVVQGPFTVAASRLMFEREVTARSVLRQFLGRFWGYLGGLIYTRVVQAIGALVVVAFPWAWAHGAFIHEAILLEGQGATGGAKRASSFVAGQYGPVITLGLCLGVAVCLFAVVADQIGAVVLDFGLQVGRPFESLWDDGGSLTALLGFFAGVPYLATVRFLQYIDARTRRDGWDLQFAFLGLVTAAKGTSGGGA